MTELGSRLRSEREEKGLTLDDLAGQTRIQKRYLQAIEDGNTDILPGRFYMRAFVKQYADIVDLDGEELLEEHLTETSKEASEEFAENVNVAPTRTEGKQEGFLSDITEYLPMILIFLLVATIIVVIYFAFRQYNPAEESNPPMINEENTEQVAPAEDEEEEPEATDDEEEAEENIDEEEPEETEEEEEEQTISVSESSGSNTIYEIKGPHPEEQTVTLTANGGDSWVSVTVEGGDSDARLLTSGESLDMSFGADVTQVDIVIGNAPVTEVTFNDTELEYAPESSGVVRQDLQLQFVE